MDPAETKASNLDSIKSTVATNFHPSLLLPAPPAKPSRPPTLDSLAYPPQAYVALSYRRNTHDPARQPNSDDASLRAQRNRQRSPSSPSVLPDPALKKLSLSSSRSRFSSASTSGRKLSASERDQHTRSQPESRQRSPWTASKLTATLPPYRLIHLSRPITNSAKALFQSIDISLLAFLSPDLARKKCSQSSLPPHRASHFEVPIVRRRSKVPMAGTSDKPGS